MSSVLNRSRTNSGRISGEGKVETEDTVADCWWYCSGDLVRRDPTGGHSSRDSTLGTTVPERGRTFLVLMMRQTVTRWSSGFERPNVDIQVQTKTACWVMPEFGILPSYPSAIFSLLSYHFPAMGNVCQWQTCWNCSWGDLSVRLCPVPLSMFDGPLEKSELFLTNLTLRGKK